MSADAQQLVEPADQTLVERPIGRRDAMRAGLAGAMVATGAVSMSSMPVAANSAINYSSPMAPRPWLAVDEVRLRRHYGDYAELEYENDAGEVVNLTDEMGFVVPSEDPATRDEDDEEDKNAWNPFTLDPRNFFIPRTKAAPRDAEDDDDDPIHWYQTEWWTTSDASVNSASLQSLEFEGNAGGTATFDGDGEVEVTGSLGGLRLHMVFDVDELDAAGEIHINVGDGTNYVTAKIDPDGDADDDDIIATETGSSLTAEPRLEDLDGDITAVEEITEIEVEFVGEYGELRIYGLDWEQSGRADWGTRQIKDEDDEFDTETVRTPQGEYSIQSLTTLPSMGSDDHIRDIKVQGELRASEVPADQVDVSFEEAGRHGSGTLDRRMRLLVNLKADDDDFNVSWEDFDGLWDEVGFDSTNYIEVGYEMGLDEAADLEDYDDDDLDLTDVTGDYESESIDEEFQVATGVSSGEYIAVYFDIRMTEADESELQATVTAPPPTDQEPGGIFDWIMTPFGAVATAITGLGIWRFAPRIMGRG